MRVTHIPGVRGGREDGRHGGNQPEREHGRAEHSGKPRLAAATLAAFAGAQGGDGCDDDLGRGRTEREERRTGGLVGDLVALTEELDRRDEEVVADDRKRAVIASIPQKEKKTNQAPETPGYASPATVDCL